MTTQENQNNNIHKETKDVWTTILNNLLPSDTSIGGIVTLQENVLGAIGEKISNQLIKDYGVKSVREVNTVLNKTLASDRAKLSRYQATEHFYAKASESALRLNKKEKALNALKHNSMITAQTKAAILNSEIKKVMADLAKAGSFILKHAGSVATAVDLGLALKSNDSNEILKSAVVNGLGIAVTALSVSSGLMTVVPAAIIGSLVTITASFIWDLTGLGELTGLSGRNFREDLLSSVTEITDRYREKYSWYDATINVTTNLFESFADFVGLNRADTQKYHLTDPLVLDLNGDGIKTLAASGYEGALFDEDGDGIRSAMGWVDKHDGLLVHDINGDGKINNGREILGDAYILANGQTARHGYEALASFDSNGDGKIDTQDSAFTSLSIWQDTNSNALTDEGELHSLNSKGIKTLNLSHQETQQALEHGNSLSHLGEYEKSDGSQRQMGDINLKREPFFSEYVAPIPLTEQQKQWMNLKGTGYLRDLRQAAATSPELAQTLQAYQNAPSKEEQIALAA